MHYYDPMFYICSEKMPFGIRIEVTLKDVIDGKALDRAVNTAIKRYPYFSVRLVKKDGDVVTEYNDLPIKAFEGKLPCPLGDERANYHIFATSYSENKINFYVTHVITDGAGFMPLIKSVLYYYVTERLGKDVPHESIRLVETPFFDDETTNPYPEEKMANATQFCLVNKKEFFRFSDGGFVKDDTRVSYNFRAKESDVMKFSRENDASPCTFFSSIMAKAIWRVHPNEKRDIVSAISFNMRSALGNKNGYRLTCNAILVRYPKKLSETDVRKICTCTRGTVMIQSQPEHVLYYAKNKKEQLEKLLALKSIEEKKRVLSKTALEDSVNNTFSVSYVGKTDYDGVKDQIVRVRNYTDGSTYKTVFIEIMSNDGWFTVTMLQGFTSDVYYKALLEELKENGIEYVEEGVEPLDTPDIKLP